MRSVFRYKSALLHSFIDNTIVGTFAQSSPETKRHSRSKTEMLLVAAVSLALLANLISCRFELQYPYWRGDSFIPAHVVMDRSM
jgi:hypothetical protein